jgi:hypothetical protein
MATHASNYSNRYIVKYRAAAKTHSMSFCYGTTPASPPAGLITGVSNLITALAPKLVADWAVLAASYIEAGTTSAFPATPPTGVGTGVTPTPGDAPREWSFTGRGNDAAPAAIYIFGAAADPGDGTPSLQDFRVLRAEDTDIGSALDELAGATDLTTLSGRPILWNQYANLRYNAYWQTKLRRG